MKLARTEASFAGDGDWTVSQNVVSLKSAEQWDIKVAPDSLLRVPNGDYSCKYLGHETALLFNSGKIILKFEVMDGPHTGLRLIKPYRAKKLIGRPAKGGRFELGRSSELLRDVVRLNDLKVRPDRLSLHFLTRRLWTVRTRTVEKDYKQRPIPEPLMYSVIDLIVEAETG